MSLGQRIRHLRQSSGLTQSELGGTELSKSFISLLEKDRAHPSLDTLILLAQRLGSTVDSLLGQTGNLPEMITQGMLVLTKNAIRARQFDKAVRYLEMVKFIAAGTLGEVSREAQLQAAELAIEQREFGAAEAMLEEASSSNEHAGDQWRLGRAFYLQGLTKLRQRELAGAERGLQRSLSVLRRARAGRDPARVEALIALGTTLMYMGRYAMAIRRYEEALRSDAARHDPKLRAHALWGIGLTHRKMRDHAAAKRFLLAAKDVLESIEEIPDYIIVLKGIGQLIYEQGNGKEALRYLHLALRAAERLKMRVIYASTLTEIGRINLSLGNLEEAEHFAGQALAKAKEVGDPVEVAEATAVLARISAERDDAAPTIRLFKEALAAFKELKVAAKASEVAHELGLFLRQRGAHAQAARYLAISLEERTTHSSAEVEQMIAGPVEQDSSV
jgi:tetratricopeptide (TPR) repeat protein